MRNTSSNSESICSSEDRYESINVGSVIKSSTDSYKVEKILGQGTFGRVFLCRKASDDRLVAIKTVSDARAIRHAQTESQILKNMKAQGAENHNIYQWFESFNFQNVYCLEFEPLDISLHDYLQKKKKLSLPEMRPILFQVVTALYFLKNQELIHGDLKPENIMLVNHEKGLKAKVIDFGAAHYNYTVVKGEQAQTCWYRAPDVFLGMKYTEAIDMWSLGCIALQMLTGRVLFPGSDTHETMSLIVRSVGNPPEAMLNEGKYTGQFFVNLKKTHVWCMKRRQWESIKPLYKINELKNMYSFFHDSTCPEQKKDYENFVDLVEKLLSVNCETRITPQEVLDHPFITMSDFDGILNNDYVNRCMELMQSTDDNAPDDSAPLDEEQPCCSNTLEPTNVLGEQRDLEKERGTDRQCSNTNGQTRNRTTEPTEKNQLEKQTVNFVSGPCQMVTFSPTTGDSCDDTFSSTSTVSSFGEIAVESLVIVNQGPLRPGLRKKKLMSPDLPSTKVMQRTEKLQRWADTLVISTMPVAEEESSLQRPDSSPIPILVPIPGLIDSPENLIQKKVNEKSKTKKSKFSVSRKGKQQPEKRHRTRDQTKTLIKRKRTPFQQSPKRDGSRKKKQNSEETSLQRPDSTQTNNKSNLKKRKCIRFSGSRKGKQQPEKRHRTRDQTKTLIKRKRTPFRRSPKRDGSRKKKQNSEETRMSNERCLQLRRSSRVPKPVRCDLCCRMTVEEKPQEPKNKKRARSESRKGKRPPEKRQRRTDESSSLESRPKKSKPKGSTCKDSKPEEFGPGESKPKKNRPKKSRHEEFKHEESELEPKSPPVPSASRKNQETNKSRRNRSRSQRPEE